MMSLFVGRVLLTGLFVPMMINTASAAAPLCVVAQGMTPQCYYYDAQQCRQAAQKVSGVCSSNPDEPAMAQGNSVYCKFRADKISECIYDDYNMCNRDARREGAVCVRNQRKYVPPEPFQYQNGVYN